MGEYKTSRKETSESLGLKPQICHVLAVDKSLNFSDLQFSYQ